MFGKENKSDFGEKINKIFAESSNKTTTREEYTTGVEEAYDKLRNKQLSSALKKALVNTEIDIPISTLINVVLMSRNINRILRLSSDYNKEDNKGTEEVMNKLINFFENGKSKDIIGNLIDYGLEKNIASEKVVLDDEAMWNAIKNVYGSLENYKEENINNVERLYNHFKKIGKIEENPVLDGLSGITSFLSKHSDKISSYLTKDKEKGKKISEEISFSGTLVDKLKKEATKVSNFGIELVKEYADIKTQQITRYERIDEKYKRTKQ